VVASGHLLGFGSYARPIPVRDPRKPRPGAFGFDARVELAAGRTRKGGEMYIGGGLLTLIVVILLLVWLL
jgi:hypothetical protein